MRASISDSSANDSFFAQATLTRTRDATSSRRRHCELRLLRSVAFWYREAVLSFFARERTDVDEDGVRRMRGKKVIEQVLWKDLVGVSIVTTDAGPVRADFFWLLHANDGTGCSVSHEVAHPIGLLERLQRLPGFDNSAVIAASSSTTRAEFKCWRGRPGDAVLQE